MKRNFSARYQVALLAYLKNGAKKNAQPGQGWGEQARAAGLQTLDLAKLHEHTLVTLVLARRPAAKRKALIKKAGLFFSNAISGSEKAKQGGETAQHLNKVVGLLSQRTVELAASNLALQLEIVQRKAVEAALKKSEHHYSHLLAESDRLQQQLRQLSRQILSAQEEERKAISRELHDVIAQALAVINVRLATLAREAGTSGKGLDQNILKTQRLVEKSVDIVHRFARELRPAVLDDLGLIPALHSFLKNFTARTGVRTRLTAFSQVEKLDTAHRTALFRVAQEALTNVSRHAKASLVRVAIVKRPGFARMEIKDNGISFDVKRKMNSKAVRRLGLLGMRERVEMVGGTFSVVSAPGKGTKVRVDIPFHPALKPKIKAP